jgi:nicotinate-nucleotide--dimethylbenzimidazole phosphoribosyltransferase
MQIPHIQAPDRDLSAALQQKIDQKTKPLGALGRLEPLAMQLGLIQQTLTPELLKPVMMVFAADHGIVAAGVSPYPQAVTMQMVMNFLQGGAAINVFARQVGMQIRIVDAGVNHDFAPHPMLLSHKVAMGTKNMLEQPAMSEAECAQAMSIGRQLAHAEIENGSNVLAFGEMGIGNTTAAAALMAALCQLPAQECVGRGTGLDDAGLQRKVQIVQQVLHRHASYLNSPLAVLQHVGGLEIAMMAGAMLGAAEKRAVVLVDGFICTAALLVASRLAPAVLDYAVFAHCSGEQGHRRLLQALQAQPLLDIGLRLGEGTGAALAYPLLQAAANFMREMASFESAGVDGKSV